MKKIFYAIMAFAAILSSCNKDENIQEASSEKIAKTFTASVPETKTTLDGVSVKWAAGDEIGIVAATTGNQYTFTLSDGAGTGSATFTGTIDAADAAETTFYAVYPNQAVTISSGKIVYSAKLNCGSDTQTAVAGGFDPAYSVMVATADSDGKLAFSHRSAFLKLTLGNDKVSNINLKTGGTRFYGRPTVPIDDANIARNSGYYAIDGAQDNVNLGGTLTKGETYYIPVPIKNSKVGTITLTFSFSDGTSDKTLSTTTWTNNYLEVGKIYNLGTPTVSTSPEFSADDVALAYSDKAGTITFTVGNLVDGGTVTAAIKSGDISNLALGTVSFNTSTGVGSIPFTCDANTADAKSSVVTLTYTYNDPAETVTKDVTISQAKYGATVSHDYVFYVNSSGSVVQTMDGETCTYFTTAGGATALSSDYNQTFNPWTIGSYSSSRGWKLNSSGAVSFTTSTSLTTTVQFYFIRRKTGDSTAKIQILPTGGTATVFDTPYDSLGDSGVLTLSKGTEYTIKQSTKEQALLLVLINES